jgi:hypothetical protein
MRLMKRSSAPGAAVMTMAIAFAMSAPARADSTLYDQPTDLAGAYTSQTDTSGGGLGSYATAYDNFTLGTASTIDSVTWVGSYSNPATQVPISAFSISFYADNAGVPDALLQTENISGNANETSLGTDGSGNPAFSYSADVTPFSVAAGTQYWLSIVAYTDGATPAWGWETGIGGDGNAYQVYGAGGPIPNDLAFSLVGNAVPEPSTLVMLSIGAVSALGFGWRRRNTARFAGHA